VRGRKGMVTVRAWFPSVSVALQRCVSSVTDRRTSARGWTTSGCPGAGLHDTAARRGGPTVGPKLRAPARRSREHPLAEGREHPLAGREDRPVQSTTTNLLAAV